MVQEDISTASAAISLGWRGGTGSLAVDTPTLALRLTLSGEQFADLAADMMRFIVCGIAANATSGHLSADPDPPGVLSGRQRAVLQLIGSGCTNGEISRRLSISEKTVKNHASALFSRLGVRDRTQAVLEGIRRGWIHVDQEREARVLMAAQRFGGDEACRD